MIDVCPKFPNSVAPILFHLPERTADRILENIAPEFIGPAFVENGRSLFGTDRLTLKEQLPRWSVHYDIGKATKLAMILSNLVIRKSHSIPELLLPNVIQTVGNLVEARLISAEVSNEVLKEILPICLERNQLNKSDVYKIVIGIGKIPISQENAIVFPMISNFATWFLERNRINASKRHEKKLLEKRLCLLS